MDDAMMDGMASGILGGLFALGGFLILILLICLAVVILSCYSQYKVLKLLEYDKPWLAWIPFANAWAMANVTLDENGNGWILGKEINGGVYCFGWLIIGALNIIPVIGSLASMVCMIIYWGSIYIPIYATMEDRDESDVAVVGYLSAAIPIIALIKFLTY